MPTPRLATARRSAPPLLPVALLAALAACSGGGGSGPEQPPPGGTPPLIATVAPSAGAAGQEVTITGLNFAATAAGDTVRFNGTPAGVVSATGTTILVTVPAGATTGRIQVTTAGGTATSAADFTVLTGLGAAWTTRLAGPYGSPRGLAWTGSRYVAVGGSGAFQVSTDGLVWTATSAFSSADDVAWDGTRLVAVGGSFWVYTSPDGRTWSTQLLPGGLGALVAVARSPSTWVAVGRSGSVASSPDGVTWTARASGTAKDLGAVAWTAGRFVAVGADGAVTTSPDGLAWTAQAPPTTDTFTAVGGTSTLAVATTFPYSGSTSALLTSQDGAAWTPRVSGLPSFERIVHAGGLLVGTGAYRSATSTDGLGWDTSGTMPGFGDGLAHDGARFVAVGMGRNGAAEAYASADGLAWTTLAADHDLVAVARRPSDGLLVTVGSDTARTSADGGATWTVGWLTSELAQNYPFLDLVWSPSESAFLALVQVAANQDAYRSVDGQGWTRVGSVPCYGGLAVSDAGLLLAIGTSYAGACVATSATGASWTTGTAPAGLALRDAIWAGDRFLAFGNGGAVATSDDGLAWTARTSTVTAGLRGAAASPSRVVVVGDGGTIVTSDDGGATFTARTSGTTASLRRVAWTGQEFLAVGSAGKLLRSADGAAWTTQPTPWTSGANAHDLTDLAYLPGGGGALVLVGTQGLVATSSGP